MVLTADKSTIRDIDGLPTEDSAFSYQWNRAGAPIHDATSSTYTLTQDDVGSTITVTVSYTDGQGTRESVTSAATKSIAGIIPVKKGWNLINTPKDNIKITDENNIVVPNSKFYRFEIMFLIDV